MAELEPTSLHQLPADQQQIYEVAVEAVFAFIVQPALTFSEAVDFAASRRLDIGSIPSRLEMRRVLFGIKVVSDLRYPEEKRREFWSHALSDGARLYSSSSVGRGVKPADIYRRLRAIPAEVQAHGFQF